MLAWLNGSDNPPPASVEKAYIEVLKEADWPNPYLSSASATATTVTGPSGVKMTGPYDYVAAGLLADGRCRNMAARTDSSLRHPAGPSVPLVGSLQKDAAREATAPDSVDWNYHAGSLGFKDLSHVEEAMKADLRSASRDIEDYERKAQAMAYDSERAMFEAYSRNKYESTGIIQWMLNNAWPSLIWHLVRLLLAAGRRIFWSEESLRAAARAVFLRRPQRGGGEQPLRGRRRAYGDGGNLRSGFAQSISRSKAR